jgi:ferredoxin-NADP reductase
MIQTFKASLSKKEQLTKDVWRFVFSINEGGPLQFEAGQYLVLHVPQATGTMARRLYSLSSSNSFQDSFEFVVQLVSGGIASEYLRGLEMGHEVVAQGPAGVFTLKHVQKNKVFLATGTGIAPMWSMILSTIAARQFVDNYYLLWGLRHQDDMYFTDEMKAIAAQYPNFHPCVCLSRESAPDIKQGIFAVPHRIDECLKETFFTNPVVDPKTFEYYICGGVNVVNDLRSTLLNAGIPKEQVYVERFV